MNKFWKLFLENDKKFEPFSNEWIKNISIMIWYEDIQWYRKNHNLPYIQNIVWIDFKSYIDKKIFQIWNLELDFDNQDEFFKRVKETEELEIALRVFKDYQNELSKRVKATEELEMTHKWNGFTDYLLTK